MAYREFKNEPYFKAPEIDYFPRTINLLQQAVQQKRAQQRQDRALAANYKADKLQSKFTTDQEELNYLTQANTESAVNDYKNYGMLSANTQEQLGRAQGYKAESDAQWAMKEDLEKSIQDRVIRGPKAEKNYFKKDVAQQRLIEAAYGRDNERVTWNERSQRLNQAANTIGKDYINEFNKDAFVSDYVDEMKTQTAQRSNKGQSGASSDKTIIAAFFDENGVPKVTDKHAIDFLNSSPDVQERYKQEVDLELIDDARKMAATKEGAWVGELLKTDPQQVIKTFREKPELNTITKVNPGQRERELARKDLDAKHRISLKNSYDASDLDEGAARGITSKDYGLENAYNKNEYGGTGGIFINKKTGTKGIPIKIGRAYDKNSMKLTGNDKSPRTLFADTFNLLPVDSRTNTPLQLGGQSVDEQIASLNRMPDHVFENLSLKTVIHGKAYNTADLDQSRKELKGLEMTPPESLTDDQRKRMGELANTLNELDQNPDLAPEVIQSKLGIVVEDIIKPIDPGTTEAKEIKGRLGNFDVTDPKKWDDDQKRLAEAFNARKKKAQQNQYARSTETAEGGPVSKKDKATATTPPKAPPGRVMMKGSDGKNVWILKEQIEAAKEQGYSLVK